MAILLRQPRSSDDADRAIANHIETNYPLGRLVQVSTPASSTTLRYDALGRVQSSKQSTPGDFIFGYSYNAVGLTSMSYPSGRTVNYSFDGAGRASGVTNGATGASYASAFQYTPPGAISQLKLGNNVVETTSFNNRLQPYGLDVRPNGATNPLLHLDWLHCPAGTSNDACDSNNGNVAMQNIQAGTPTNLTATFSQTYAYDKVNRITQVTETASGSASLAMMGLEIGRWRVHRSIKQRRRRRVNTAC